MINVLVAAALHGGTLESAWQDLALKVDSHPLRAYLNKPVEVSGWRAPEGAVHRSLRGWLAAELPRDKCEMALD